MIRYWCKQVESSVCPRLSQRNTSHEYGADAHLNLCTVQEYVCDSALQVAAPPGMHRAFRFSAHSVFGTLRAPSTGPLSDRSLRCHA